MYKLGNDSLDWYQATKNRYMNCQISSEKFLKVESFDDKFNLVMPKINRFINFSCDINLIFDLKFDVMNESTQLSKDWKLNFQQKMILWGFLYRKCFNLLMTGQKNSNTICAKGNILIFFVSELRRQAEIIFTKESTK